MAFTPKEKEISQIIEASSQPDRTPNEVAVEFESFERKKQFQFTLKPSNRKKLDEIAKAVGAKSASDYLDKLIESLSL
ncbi:MAG: hypothetical protein E7A25_02290 [Streptococcus mitis]|jgi:hypothetical protein|uniref:Uncharacterized protein n=1 Tax=Streptococcus oralis subsp. oralis TaxID=1891914 RepID=A0A7H9FHM8_STROR|nr:MULTISPECIES: hypothetical protein [Streptococcus]MBW8202405.1 hypothetical protein [Streptococcus oralis]MDO6346954.1 hypothetical protein [Streptococcus sp. GP0011]MDU1096997.1 hypothetical protein [Streptococcus mitis]QLL98094.1 hypothetical protein HRE59_03525 [Streptococcus oralis subsp. oralis]